MIADMTSADDVAKIWNMFYHLYLDPASSTFLSSQCRKLAQLSSSIETWNRSQYASFLRVCDIRTLSELHRYWDLYVAYADSPEPKKSQLELVDFTVKKMLDNHPDPTHPGVARSVGYYWLNAVKTMPASFSHFGLLEPLSPTPER